MCIRDRFPSSQYDFSYISVINSNTIWDLNRRALIATSLVLIILAGGALLVSFVGIRNDARFLSNIMQMLGAMENGDFSVAKNLDIHEENKNEYGRIAIALKDVSQKLEGYIRTEYILKLKQQEADVYKRQLLESMGKDPHQWYLEPKLWPPFLIFMYMWKNLGYSMVVYLATITGIDKTYYEAAGIDGATVWQQMRYVTLPLMKTVIIMMFIMAVGRIFYSDFGLFYQVPRDSNSLYNVSYTLDVFVFKQLKSSTTGMASAAAFVQSVAGCITILTANAIVRKVDRESAMI